MEQNKIKFASICLVACVLAAPADGQPIDTSGLNNFFVSVLNALTGLAGRLFMTIVAVGALIAGRSTSSIGGVTLPARAHPKNRDRTRMKTLHILQFRPETDASDDEYASIPVRCAMSPEQTRRIRLDQEVIPSDLDVTDFSAVIVGGGPGCVSDTPEEKVAQMLGSKGGFWG